MAFETYFEEYPSETEDVREAYVEFLRGLEKAGAAALKLDRMLAAASYRETLVHQWPVGTRRVTRRMFDGEYAVTVLDDLQSEAHYIKLALERVVGLPSKEEVTA